MKTKVFSACILFSKMSAQLCLLMIMLCVGQAQSHACNMPSVTTEILAERACLQENYFAAAPLPEGVTTNASITIVELFGNIPGFQYALLDAYVDGASGSLSVELAGFAYDDLPSSTLIGIIKVKEAGVQWDFQVWTDGGVLAVLNDDL